MRCVHILIFPLIFSSFYKFNSAGKGRDGRREHFNGHRHEEYDEPPREEKDSDWIEGPEEVQDKFQIEISTLSTKKNVRVISDESTVEDFFDNVDSFFDTNEYLLYPHGFQSCPHPVMVQKDSDDLAAIMPYRGSAEYDLYELSIPGYDIKYSEDDVKASSLLTFLKINQISIQTLNSLVHILEFLSNKAQNTTNFWSSIQDDKNFILTRPRLLKTIIDEREEIIAYIENKTASHKVDTSSILVEHLRYSEFRVDNVQVLLTLIRYCYVRDLQITQLLQPGNLNKLLAEEKLLPLSRIMGYRMAIDKIFHSHKVRLDEVHKEIETGIPVPLETDDTDYDGSTNEEKRTRYDETADSKSDDDDEEDTFHSRPPDRHRHRHRHHDKDKIKSRRQRKEKGTRDWHDEDDFLT